ncbi:MAG: histidine kinase [Limnohabitans sp.]|nr:histidine kinase [Limnohabitans sp.]
MEQTENQAIIFAILGLAGLCIVIIILIIIFQKKKNLLLIKRIQDKKYFEKVIIETQFEIREQTLRNISWELHDNIGQLLTLAKIQLQKINDDSNRTKDINDNLTNILNEIRALTKVTNPDYISKIELQEAIKIEVDRFNRLNYIQSNLIVKGEPFIIDDKVEIIIFRILQEFFSNTIKHSRASKLDIFMKFYEAKLIIIARDNGKGFDELTIKEKGLGLVNMKDRGRLINADIEIKSKIDNGTSLSIVYYKN